jgi:molecular chaperone GrpE
MTDTPSKTDDLEPIEDLAGQQPTHEGVDGIDAALSDDEVEAPAPDAAGAEDPLEDDLDESLDPDIGGTVDETVDVDPASGEALDQELLALREEFDGLNDRHLRLAAEFNNYRRRVEAERLDVWGRAQAEIVRRFIDVLDDLQRVAGLDLTNATVEGIMEGIDLVERKFVRMLADAGVEVVDPVGETFDPERMEAMMRVPAESEEHDDKVAEVFQKGYMLDGNLIRPARVSVHKHG